jgi:hypothetical protein
MEDHIKFVITKLAFTPHSVNQIMAHRSMWQRRIMVGFTKCLTIERSDEFSDLGHKLLWPRECDSLVCGQLCEHDRR